MEQKKYDETNSKKEVKTTSNNKTYINMNKENNECYTRKAEADKLVDYIIENKVFDKKVKIWLPFNDNGSAIYNAFKEKGFNNLIATETDFYDTNVECDVIISNPPFSGRTPLFKRFMGLNKPFIMLQPLMLFNNNTCINMLCSNDQWGFLCPKNRMGFVVNGVDKDKTTAFYSFWFCWKVDKIQGWVQLETQKTKQEDAEKLAAKKQPKKSKK